jgi:hypothetical protein
MAERAVVRNAADPRQVKRAERLDRDSAAMFTGNLREVLATPAGRLVLWELVARAGVYKSIWTPNSEIHYRAGRQDYGHELLASILEADEQLYELMEREARARARAANYATDAAHISSASEGGTT